MAYWPYGQERTGTPDGREKFGTYFRDAGGSDYADQRYYDYGAGRFHTPDPSGAADLNNPTTWNMYAYVNGDPVNFDDPRGTDACAAEVNLDSADIGCYDPCFGNFVSGVDPYNSGCGGGSGPGWWSPAAIGAAVQQAENYITTPVTFGMGDTGTLTIYGGTEATLQFGDAQTAEIAAGVYALQP
jgi:RHS repeat-associated protein